VILRTDITYTNYTKRRKLVAKRGLIVCSMEGLPFSNNILEVNFGTGDDQDRA
jgi:hypothetical protein